MIPGAEHTPTIGVGYVTEQGGFYTSIEDIPKIRRVDTGELIPDAYIEARRQLTVTDPDDQRVIWRLAALKLGASEGEATRAVMLLTTRGRHLGIATPAGRRWLWSAPPETSWSVEYATAALCAAVWGPKQATP